MISPLKLVKYNPINTRYNLYTPYTLFKRPKRIRCRSLLPIFDQPPWKPKPGDHFSKKKHPDSQAGGGGNILPGQWPICFYQVLFSTGPWANVVRFGSNLLNTFSAVRVADTTIFRAQYLLRLAPRILLTALASKETCFKAKNFNCCNHINLSTV